MSADEQMRLIDEGRDRLAALRARLDQTQAALVTPKPRRTIADVLKAIFSIRS